MVKDEASSSSITSTPLQCFSQMPLSPVPVGGVAAGSTPASAGALYAPLHRELRSDERGLCLIHLLLNAAVAVAAGRLDSANIALQHIALLATPEGDAMQRVAAHFADALSRRVLLRALPGIYRALLQLPSPLHAASETAAARRTFAELCPFHRLTFTAANQAILEAMEGEKMVHIVDLNGGDPLQYIELLQLFAARPEGPPHLRITGVHEHRELLAHAGMCLSKEAERLDIPFQFHPVVSRLDSLDVDVLKVKIGEALAVCSAFQLHTLLAESENITNTYSKTKSGINGCKHSPDSGLSSAPSTRVDSFLASLWALSPKITVIAEQESNHNASSLNERFIEALNFYAALFDCLELTSGRGSPERARVERWMLGEEIKSIVACEGSDRRERHEKLDRWTKRLEFAGFGRVPMSYYGLLHARRLLQGFGCEGYKVKEEDGGVFLCWQERPLYSLSAWSCRRLD